MRVLVCDDQADVVEALRLLLKGAGYRIETADSPSSLVGKLGDGRYDMVLMDMNYTRDTTSGAEAWNWCRPFAPAPARFPLW